MRNGTHKEMKLTYTAVRPGHLRGKRGVSVSLTGAPDLSRRFFVRRNGIWLNIGERAYHVGFQTHNGFYKRG